MACIPPALQKTLLFLVIACFLFKVQAQENLYTSYTTDAGRAKLYRNLMSVSINKNLSLALSDSTEEKWQEAFSALELLQYRSAWMDDRVSKAFDSVAYRSAVFQASLLELAYSNYPESFTAQVTYLLGETNDPKVFSLSAEYLLRQRHDKDMVLRIGRAIKNKFPVIEETNPFVSTLNMRLSEFLQPFPSLANHPYFTDILNKEFLAGKTVMYSFHRKNRDYPGVTVIRNKDGSFIKDSTGMIFNIPQLARSITDLPYYLSNGNTPQGLFIMKGFNVSRSNFIGPTANVQLAMPVEENIASFLNDSDIVDTTWQPGYYARLLPARLVSYRPLYESYYAGLAGRREIIAHGTTVDPEYYKNRPWYPCTPSQGCLSAKELWNGKRIESDQQKLVYALLSAGGAHGYCVVLEIDDKQAPVTIGEILPFLLRAQSIE